MSALLSASWVAVRPLRLASLVVAVAVLVLGTAPWQDSGYAVPVMHGVALLVACVVVLCTDDPAAEVVAATPRTRSTRTLVRLALGFTVAVTTYLAAALVVEARFEPSPSTALGVEMAAYLLVAAALGATLRARGVHAPAYPAALVLLVLTFVVGRLPREYLMVDPQPWGAPWEAALLRWGAVALLAATVLVVALRDPAGWVRGRGRGR